MSLDPLDANHAWDLTGDDFGTEVRGDVTRDKLALTLHRPTDGGRTWQVAGTYGRLATELATPDASTIWAVSAGDAGPVERRIFAVSCDGGRTWRDVPLPGVPRAIGQWATLLQPPIFVDGLTGVAPGSHNGGTGIADIDRSDDAGRTWARVSTTTATSLAAFFRSFWVWQTNASSTSLFAARFLKKTMPAPSDVSP